MKNLILALGFLALSALAAPPQERTEDDVQAELNQEKSKEQAAKEKIGALETDIAQLRSQVESARAKNADISRQVYVKAGVTPEAVEAYFQKLGEFTTQVNGFQAQYASVPKDWETAVVWAEYQLNSVWKPNPAAQVHQADTLLALAEQAVSSSRIALDKEKQKLKADSLAVLEQRKKMQQDSLDAIAKAKETAEQEKVSRKASREKHSPVPATVVKSTPIPETSTFDGQTYRVGKYSEHKDGTLWDISAIVYQSPYKWQRLWRANRDQIKDPDHVLPGTVLVVPTGYVPK